MVRFAAALLAAIALSIPAAAADGDACPGGPFLRDPVCVLLCDDASVVGPCNAGQGIAVPGQVGQGLMFEVSQATGAGPGLRVTVSWASSISGDVRHPIATLDEANSWAHYVQTGIAVPGYLFADVVDAADASAVDVKVHREPR